MQITDVITKDIIKTCNHAESLFRRIFRDALPADAQRAIRTDDLFKATGLAKTFVNENEGRKELKYTYGGKEAFQKAMDDSDPIISDIERHLKDRLKFLANDAAQVRKAYQELYKLSVFKSGKVIIDEDK